MPEVHFTVRWPDGTTDRCYSPSTAIQNYLSPDTTYAKADFSVRVRAGLNEASERVRQKFGFACSSAASQLSALEHKLTAINDDQSITVEAID